MGILTWIKTALGFAVKHEKVIKKVITIVAEEFDETSGVDLHTNASSSDLSKNEKSAIIFIHGFKGNQAETWGKTFDFLRERNEMEKWDIYSYGYNSSLMPNILKGIWASEASITHIGESFREEIITRINEGYKSICLCAHSMGGLATQQAIIGLNNEQLYKLDSVILFGTPSNGLIKAKRAKLINFQIRDMGKESDFIKALRKNWTESFGDGMPFKFLAVRGGRDQFVPKESSTDVFPDDQVKSIEGDHVSIVKPDGPEDPIITTIIDKIFHNKNYSNDWDRAQLAVERAKFNEAVQIYGKTDFNELQKNAQVNYILSLEALGHKEKVDELIHKISNSSSDAASVTGGRYKRKYLDSFEAKQLQRSIDWYTLGFKLAKDNEDKYYAAINLALLESLNNNRTDSSNWVNIAFKAAQESTLDNIWKYATLGECFLHKNDFEQALAHYKEALNRAKSIREKDSILINALELMNYGGSTNKQIEELIDMFKSH